MASRKYYVVWRGRRSGLFASWDEAEKQVKGFPGAQYKSFETREEAERAFSAEYSDFEGRASSQGKWRTARVKPEVPSICADAACDGSPGRLEYRCVQTETGAEILKAGPFADGTNNVGEFLAIFEAVRWLLGRGLNWPVYSDSSNAIGWVKAGKCHTKLKRTRANERLFDMIARAEKGLRADLSNNGGNARRQPRVLKWDTAAWGEIPADFGRK